MLINAYVYALYCCVMCDSEHHLRDVSCGAIDHKYCHISMYDCLWGVGWSTSKTKHMRGNIKVAQKCHSLLSYHFELWINFVKQNYQRNNSFEYVCVKKQIALKSEMNIVHVYRDSWSYWIFVNFFMNGIRLHLKPSSSNLLLVDWIRPKGILAFRTHKICCFYVALKLIQI